jgi:membrane protease subunit (stomatin/prohibitin family)
MARIFDLIECPDQAADQIVRRFPESGSGDFRIGSRVIVREFQKAVFFRDGKALDTFEAGTHEITTMNVPLLANLIGMAFGGKTPFTAEVYFVNMKEFLDMKWGTPEAVPLRDTDLGMVRLRAFGSYSMQVSDPQLFVTKIVGGQGLYDTREISNYLRGIIISSTIDLLGENMTSIFDLPKLFDELAAGVKAKVQDSFDGLGLQLKTFFIQSISPTEETQKAMDQAASIGALSRAPGGMQSFMQWQAAQAMRDAAQQEGGGGLTGAGLGLGAGAGMGAMMGQMMGQAMQPGQAQPPPQAAPKAAAATIACPKCGTQNQVGAKFCNNCGEKLGGNFCPKCGTANPPGAKFCNSCGQQLSG